MCAVTSGAVTTEKVLEAAITSTKISDGAVTSAKIADASIVAGDIATSAVTSDKILDGTITAADLASGSVSSDKLDMNAGLAIKGGVMTIADSSVSFTKDTGALVVQNGGLGVEGNINAGKGLTVADGVTTGGALAVSGASTLQGTLSVGQATSIGASLTVAGEHARLANAQAVSFCPRPHAIAIVVDCAYCTAWSVPRCRHCAGQRGCCWKADGQWRR